jgi:iron complex transport system substrate-binding protein
MMMKRTLRPAFVLFALSTAVLTLFVSCGAKQPAASTAGGPAATAGAATAGVSAPPRRVISAAPSNTEIIVGLGLAGRLIAVDKYSLNIEGVDSGLPVIDFFYPDVEAIIGMEPDLIISNEINSFGSANAPFTLIKNTGIAVLQVPTSVSIEGIFGDIRLIAGTLGAEDEGEALIASMIGEIEKISAVDPTPGRSVYFEIAPSPGMVSFGSGAYLNEMIEIIGGRNIFADQKGWFSPGAEAIIQENPDVILAMQYGDEDPVPEILSRGGFETIEAVKNGRVYAIEADPASRPSQNIIKALKQMARSVYPEYYEAD